MKPEIFNSCWGALINVYAATPGVERITPETQKLYYKALHRIPDGLFINGVERAQTEDGREADFFPSIGRLGRKSMGCDDWEAEIDRREKLAELEQARKYKRIEARPDPEEQAKVKQLLATLSDKFKFPKG